MGSADDWVVDARTVRALWRVLAREAVDHGPGAPQNHEELVVALLAARERLRRRLLAAEGVDPRTGRLLG